MKLALFNIVSRYELVPSDKTPKTLDINPKAGVVATKGPLHIKAMKRG